MQFIRVFASLLIFLVSNHVIAEESLSRFWVTAEIGPVWQTKNEVQIPSDTGTRFSIADLSSGAATAGRIYLGYRFDQKHEVRALYAPLSVTTNGTFDRNIDFQNQTFSSGTPVEAKYRFNSYRLTYRYVFKDAEKWTMRVGVTGKIRDAEIRLTQGSLTASRDNVGFVPLLHFSAIYNLCPQFNFHFDADALAAPQGRAEDVALFLGYEPNEQTEFLMGYRTVEGGADGGGGVYNFAWLHYLVAGMKYSF